MASNNPFSLTQGIAGKIKGLFGSKPGPQGLKMPGVGLEKKVLGTFFLIVAFVGFGFGIILSAIVVLQFFIIIINKGAYITPKSTLAGAGDIPVNCQGVPGPAPSATGILWSPDHRYAFPMTPFPELWYGCNHWGSNRYATDIGFIGDTAAPPNPGRHSPILAYTSGKIEGVSLNDSLGGKYIILGGSDGRYYYYAHNCQVYVKQGDSVTAGQVIATSDNTGSAATTIEHLHFAINAPPLGYNFYGGGGNVCPATDFQQKFTTNYCTKYCE